jgi:flagellar protein FlaF
VYAALQLDAYRTTQKASMTGRDIEAGALTKAALLLEECKNDWDAHDRNVRLSKALKMNQLIWSIFQADLMKEDNPLPKQLRQDILTLSLFIDRRIIDVLAYPAPEKLDAIIGINQNIAAGLRGASH